jgi:hypothetical protein
MSTDVGSGELPRTVTFPALPRWVLVCSDATRVLYLAGWGRSGSTLAEGLLNQLPDLVGVGEVKFLWERGLVQNRRCSCGSPLRQCDFWTAVLRETFGDLPDEATVAALDAASRRFRTRHLPRLLLRPHRRPYPDLAWYYAALGRLYRSAGAVRGARVVVDSSKFPSYLAALLHTPELDVRVAHIVRDPRAVAYSWQRDKEDPDAPGGGRMPKLHPGATAAYWSVWNLATERLVRRAGVPYLRFRYEDLVGDPDGTLGALGELAGVPGPAEPIGAAREVVLERSHQVSGNPVRFRTGAVPLQLDDEWRTEMAPADRRIAAAVSGPLLHRYGYRERSERSATM